MAKMKKGPKPQVPAGVPATKPKKGKKAKGKKR